MDETTDIDAIVAETEASTNQDIPMTSDEQVHQPAPEHTASTPQEYEFDYQGQKVKAPVEKILKWAQMGYGAPNKIGELSKKLHDYEGRFKQYESYDNVYKPIDEWAKQNPDKWQSLVNNWQQAQFGVNPEAQAQGQQAQIPQELIQKIQSIEQKFNQAEQKEVIQRQHQQDQSLDGEVQSIRKSYPNLDFDSKDEHGNSLEYRILEHATKLGIPSFRAAFRDYCFDQVTGLSESKGRESAQLSPKTKAALLGKDQAASRGRPMPDLKTKNYDQIHELVLSELGLG